MFDLEKQRKATLGEKGSVVHQLLIVDQFYYMYVFI